MISDKWEWGWICRALENFSSKHYLAGKCVKNGKHKKVESCST